MGQLTKNEVFALAVQRYSDAVYRTAVHNCRSSADAEDVVQDVYEKLLHYTGSFESEEHLKAWLLRVAINRCRDLTRAAYQKDTELDETGACWMRCVLCRKTTAMRSTCITTKATRRRRSAG